MITRQRDTERVHFHNKEKYTDRQIYRDLNKKRHRYKHRLQWNRQRQLQQRNKVTDRQTNRGKADMKK